MPYPNYHACRLRDPGDFDEMRITKGDSSRGPIQIVVGKLKTGDGWTAQSIRYPVEDWTEGEAQGECKKRNGIRFEPASKSESESYAAFEYKADTARLLRGDVLTFGDELKTETLRDVEIFAAGEWTDSSGRKQKWTEADLDQMVANFKTLAAKLKPYLKLMHLNEADHKRITAAPSLGWMQNLRRIGSKLVADFSNVPPLVAKLVRAGTYRRISAEIYRKMRDESTGTVYTNVVSAAGLLGAKLPAINTLADVAKLFGVNESELETVQPFEVDDWEECYGTNETPVMAFYEAQFSELQDTEGGVSMTKEERDALIAEITKDVKSEFNAKLDDKVSEFTKPVLDALGLDPDGDPVKAIKDLKANGEKATKELSERAKAEFAANVDQLIDDAKKKGKIIPADEGGIRVMVDAWTKAVDDTGKFELKLGEKNTVTGTVVDNLKAYFEALPKKYESKERGAMPEFKSSPAARLSMAVQRRLGHDGIPARVCGMEMNEEILAYASAHKCDYATAMWEFTGTTKPADPDPSTYSVDESKEELVRK